jgi:hypothetical protein
MRIMITVPIVDNDTNLELQPEVNTNNKDVLGRKKKNTKNIFNLENV